MKWYAAAAVIVVFLLIWIIQQNAADNIVRYSQDAVVCERRSQNSYPGGSNKDLHLTAVDDKEVLADTDDVMSDAVVLGEINPNR